MLSFFVASVVVLHTLARPWLHAQSTGTPAANGFNGNDGVAPSQQQSWLMQHHRYVFVIILGLIFFALVLWYIIRSIKGMRRRLREENQAHLDMIQSVLSSPQSAQPPSSLSHHHASGNKSTVSQSDEKSNPISGGRQ
ncbi:hypothetical protein BC940DRAFT_304624 [Gongronella butleri]|nr:hypothetical protein BC940DRAFT_304624 [Gongronella butleri]